MNVKDRNKLEAKIKAATALDELRELLPALLKLSGDDKVELLKFYGTQYGPLKAQADKAERELLKAAGVDVPRTSAAGRTAEKTEFRRAVNAIKESMGELTPTTNANFEADLATMRARVASQLGESDGLVSFGLLYQLGRDGSTDGECAAWYASRKIEGAASAAGLAVPGTTRAALNPVMVFLATRGEYETAVQLYARAERIVEAARKEYRRINAIKD